MDKLRELQQRFNGLVKQLRECQAEESPDATKVANIEAELRALAANIETERVILKSQEGYDGTERSGNVGEVDGDGVGSGGNEEELRAAVLGYMRTGDIGELRDMTSGTTTGGDTGGYLIPQSWERSILERTREQFVMRQIATVEYSGTDMNIPVEDDVGSAAWIDEEGIYPGSDLTFDNKTMAAYKAGRIIKVSEELLMDNQYNLEQRITEAFAYTIGFAEETAFVSGNGNKKPKGFLLDAEVGVTAASATAITFDEVIALYGSLKSQYDVSARWMFNKAALVALMKIKNGDGNYIFHPSTLPGELGNILGRPLTISSFMPDIAAGAAAIAYGDFKRYRIHDRAGFSIQRLNELYAGTGQVGFKGYRRVDGKLLVKEAVKVLKLKAAGGGGA
jgi:HK97 family phage major capsid protein